LLLSLALPFLVAVSWQQQQQKEKNMLQISHHSAQAHAYED
jgi:hypothetical protein